MVPGTDKITSQSMQRNCARACPFAIATIAPWDQDTVLCSPVETFQKTCAKESEVVDGHRNLVQRVTLLPLQERWGMGTDATLAHPAYVLLFVSLPLPKCWLCNQSPKEISVGHLAGCAHIQDGARTKIEEGESGQSLLFFLPR